MANNHMGSVEHGKLIVDELAKIAEKYDLNAAVKLQFRQLDSFIHPDFTDSSLKLVKRFKSTELNKKDFKEIINKSLPKKKYIEEKLLGNLFVQIIIEALIDNLVTPENLILLVNDPDKYKNLIEDKIESPIKKINYMQNVNYKRNNLDIKYFFFVNIDKFRLSFVKDNYPIIIDFKFSFFKWKLDKVYLPVDLLVSKINN